MQNMFSTLNKMCFAICVVIGGFGLVHYKRVHIKYLIFCFCAPCPRPAETPQRPPSELHLLSAPSLRTQFPQTCRPTLKLMTPPPQAPIPRVTISPPSKRSRPCSKSPSTLVPECSPPAHPMASSPLAPWHPPPPKVSFSAST